MNEPMYEGKETELVEELRCFHCFQTPDTPLLRCSRCNVAWYCSVTCQKEHYTTRHRNLCRGIATFQKLVQQEESRIRSAPGDDVFVSNAGEMWGWTDTIPYMEATFALADCYWRAAFECEIKQVWEKALFHLLEHLRQGALDQYAARSRVPFILLSLNRDDDAYTFIKYWVQIHIASRKDADVIYHAHENTEVGDWIYPPVEKDCRYLDLFDEIPNADPQEVEVHFLVALVIMKLRIVAVHNSAVQSLDLAMKGTSGRRIQEVQPTIQEMLVRDDVNVDRQWEQVVLLLDTIHRLNPSMLPAILNPKPLLDQPMPTECILGQPSEAYRTVVDCRRCFYRVPSASTVLEKRFGSNPSYNSNLS